MFRIRGAAANGTCESLSIWLPVQLGIDERGAPVRVGLGERNLLAAGEPGAGKSVGLNLIVAHAALSLDCRLILIDGKRVELGLWRRCEDAFIGPSIARHKCLGCARCREGTSPQRSVRLAMVVVLTIRLT
jgi:hypothetical protein